MNYIGRKYTLIDFLDEGITSFIDPSCEVFFDVFAGTGVVGWHFKRKGFRVVANDLQYYAFCLNRACVGISRQPGFTRVRKAVGLKGMDGTRRTLDYLNALKPRKGFIFQQYCPGGRARPPRMYFTDENGARCDGIRQKIESWRDAGLLRDGEYYYLIASLIEAADRVANTASVYAAYLKRIKPSAQRPLRMDPVDIVPSSARHRVHFRDGLQVVARVPCDILYMDPPYNQRQYSTNYHVLETIAAYDRPELRGLTGLRPHDGQRSAWCSRVQARDTLESMVSRSRARYCFLSYNSEGLMSQKQILDTMGGFGRVDLLKREVPRFRADVDRAGRVYRADRVVEYLFRLQVKGRS